jgi:hypothetical protein
MPIHDWTRGVALGQALSARWSENINGRYSQKD